MAWLPWFKKRAELRSGKVAQRRSKSRLSVETLEDRVTPSASTTLVSVALPTTAGSAASLTTTSSGASFSADENLLVFASDAANLVTGDTNASTDIFIANLTTGAITRVSVTSALAQADGPSFFPSISADGRYVAFQSYATNLVAGDTNGTADIFVKDLQTGTVTLMSASATGTLGNNFSSLPAISSNGQFVVYSSFATNLSPDDTDATVDVFRKNVQTGAIDVVSRSAAGVKADQASSNPAISADGRYVAFATSATNLLPANADNNAKIDVYRKDMSNGAIALVSSSSSGTIGSADSASPSISADGNIIAFLSAATNLVTGDANTKTDVFTKNMTTATTTRVSVANDGSELAADSNNPSMSSDGTKITFVTAATTVVTGDTNALADVFVRDTGANTTTRANTQAGGAQSAGGGDGGRLSPSGVKMAYFTGAADLNANDTNGLFDIYVKNRTSGAAALVTQGAAALVGGDNNSFLNASAPQISGNGLSVIFVSNSSNLVSGADGNGNFSDVYIRDLVQGQTVRVSTSSTAAQGNGDSTSSAFNPSGAAALVAFSSTSNNLVTGDTQTFEQIYLKDPFTGGIVALSRTSGGVFGNGDSFSPVLSANAQYVAFISLATNLATDTTSTAPDVYVLDRNTGTFKLASATAAGIQVAGNISGLAISDDGRYVVFATDAGLDASDTNGKLDVYVKDMTTNSLTLISKSSAGTIGNGASGSPVISADGKYIAFVSESNNLIANDVNNSADVFRSDWKNGANGTLALVSAKPDGVQANNLSGNVSISEDGRFIAFGSDASNLVANDDNSASDVFVKDMNTGTVYLASQNSGGQIGNAGSLAPSISRDGRMVAYASVSSNLTSIETNSLQNVYHTIVNHAPTVSATGATTIAVGSSLAIDLSATTDIDNDTLTYTWDLNGDGVYGDATGASIALTASQLAALGIGTTAAVHNAKVQITDAYSPTILNFDITVTSSGGPLATITPGTVGTNEGQTASFSGSATGTGTITLAWSVTRNGAAFTTGSGPNFTFDLTDSGNYVVTLTATDSGNLTGNATSQFTVINIAPTITSLNAPSIGVEGTAISFTPTTTDASSGDQTAGFTYSWTVTKDGNPFTTGSGSTVSFTPTDNGSYTIDVTAIDKDNGVSAVSSATIAVANVTPNVIIPAAATVTEGSTYTLTFSATDPGTDTISGWTINWGDGSAVENFAGTATSATHVYADGPASWTLTLTATDEDGQTFAQQSITVNDVAPTATVTGDATVLVNTVYSLQLGALVDPGQDPLSSAVIDWGDSTTTTVPLNGFNQTYQHTYTTEIDAAISVTVVNGDGTFVVATKTVQARIAPATIAISGPNTIAEGSTYTLELGAITNPASQPIDGYRIAWGDGTTTEAAGLPPATATHVFADGAFSRTITVSLLSGTTPYINASTLNVSVTDVAPTVALTAPVSVSEGDVVTLNIGAIVDPGADTISSYEINWGDGQTQVASGAVPATLTHTYTNEAASRTISLTVTNEDGTFIVGTTTLAVLNVAPTFEAGADVDLLEGAALTRAGSFTDPGSDTWTATVDYGDGSNPLTLTGKTYTLSHTYPQQGTFTVTVTINDGSGPVTDSFQVTVANVLPTVSAGADATIGVNSAFTRSGSFTDPGADTWTAMVNYGDGNPTEQLTLTGKNYTLNHTYTQFGQHTVTITVNDGTGNSVDTAVINVTNSGPAITLAPTAAISEGDTLALNGSFVDDDANSWTATVDYGLGAGSVPLTLSGKTFALSQVYPQNGSFTVTVTINDGTSTSTATTIVTVSNVAPSVDVGVGANIAQDQTFTRTGSFADPGVNDTWTGTVDYGDGTGVIALTLNSDKTFQLNHVYSQAGNFGIIIKLTDGVNTETVGLNINVAALTLSISASSVVERSATGKEIGTLGTASSLNGTSTFTLVDNAGGRFAINGRKLIVANGSLINFAIATSHTVRIRVTSGDATFEKDFTIQVTESDKGDDFIGRDPVTGEIFVARSTGTEFVTTNFQSAFDPSKNWVDILTGNFDGDGFDDVVGRDAATGQWWYGKNNGTTFAALTLWTTWSAAATWVDVVAVDMNNDGKIDVLGRNQATGEWMSAFSQGATATSEIIGKWDASKTWTEVQAIDVNRDNRIDVVGLQAGTGKFFASLNLTTSSNTGGAKLVNQISPWATLSDGNLESKTTWVDVQMADIDGDGRMDFVGRVLKTAQWYVSYGTNGKPSPAKFLAAWDRNTAYAPTFVADANGDGRADLIGRTQTTGQWYVGIVPATRGGTVVSKNWSNAGYFYTEIFAGDFDRDGKTDVAGLRTETGAWTVGLSNGADFLFDDWDLTWPTGRSSRLSIRKGRIAN